MFYRDEKMIRFETTIEPEPKYFRGTRWRSFVEKVSEDEVHLGLEMAKGDEAFETFGVTVMKRV